MWSSKPWVMLGGLACLLSLFSIQESREAQADNKVVAAATAAAKVGIQQTQEGSLDIKGDTAKVQVSKWVEVKEDRLILRSFNPVPEIKAPKDKGIYFWYVPEGVKSTDNGDTLLVQFAPKGPMTIRVKMVSAKLDKDGRFQGFITEFASSTFDVGDVSPSPGPGPAPKPDPTPPKPPVPPSEVLGFVTLASQSLAKVPTASRGHAAALANNFEAVAAQMAAVSTMTIEQANAELKMRNQATLNIQERTAWLPWFQDWQAKANTLNNNGKMTTRDHYITAYHETATGLKLNQQEQ